MNTKAERRTVDLSAYPDLVVIYLGLRVKSLKGLKTMAKLGPQIKKAVDARPDGLLLHEQLIFSLIPLHTGMRQYWRDFDSLERWARSMPHMEWWKDFVNDPAGTAFWHETYFMRGGMEAIYDDMPESVGFLQFAPAVQARGPMFSARRRGKLEGTETAPDPIVERDLYGE